MTGTWTNKKLTCGHLIIIFNLFLKNSGKKISKKEKEKEKKRKKMGWLRPPPWAHGGG
jgi:uncharacterized membrane protein